MYNLQDHPFQIPTLGGDDGNPMDYFYIKPSYYQQGA